MQVLILSPHYEPKSSKFIAEYSCILLMVRYSCSNIKQLSLSTQKLVAAAGLMYVFYAQVLHNIVNT